MANQPTKRVEFHGVDASRLGLALDAEGKVVAVDCRGYEVVAVEVQSVGAAGLGSWQGAVYGSGFPGGGFGLGLDALEAGNMGLANVQVSTDFLVLHTGAVQAGAVFNIVFMLGTKSE